MYQGLMDYLKKCPQLADEKFNFDFIGDNVGYSVTIPPNAPDVSKDVLENTKCQLAFYILSTKSFGADEKNNIENLDFFQKIREWLEKQNAASVYPDLGADKVVSGVYATTDGYIEATKTQIGRYEIQARVEYTKKANRGGLKFRKAPVSF